MSELIIKSKFQYVCPECGGELIRDDSNIDDDDEYSNISWLCVGCDLDIMAVYKFESMEYYKEED